MKKLIPFLLICLTFSGCNSELKAQSLYLDAVKEYKDRNFEQALILTDKALKSKNNFYQAEFLKSKILFFSKDFKSAEQILSKLCNKKIDNFDCKFWLLRCYIFNGELDKARIYLNELIKLNSEDWRLYYYRSQIAKQQNNFEDYFSNLNTADTFIKDSSVVYLDLALIWQELGLQERSSLCYSKAEMLKSKYLE